MTLSPCAWTAHGHLWTRLQSHHRCAHDQPTPLSSGGHVHPLVIADPGPSRPHRTLPRLFNPCPPPPPRSTCTVPSPAPPSHSHALSTTDRLASAVAPETATSLWQPPFHKLQLTGPPLSYLPPSTEASTCVPRHKMLQGRMKVYQVPC